MTARDTERGRERQREIPRRRQRKGRERMKKTKTKRQRKRASTQPCTPSSSARLTQTLTLLGRRPAVRRKPLKSGRRPRARVLAGGLRLVTEGYIRSRPCRRPFVGPRVYPRPTPPESARQIYMYLVLDVRKMFKNIGFYSVSWPSASTTGCPWCRLCVPRGQA